MWSPLRASCVVVQFTRILLYYYNNMSNTYFMLWHSFTYSAIGRVPGLNATIAPTMTCPESRTFHVKTLSPARLLVFYFLFFAVCCGLGSPTLQRYDPATVGVKDVGVYSKMVVDGPAAANDSHMLFRVLVPEMARPIYRAVNGHIGTWSPVRFSLLVVDSIFVSGSAVLLLWIGTGLYELPVGFAASLLYLLDFAVSNMQLVGLVDGAEACLLLAMVAALLADAWWALPIITVLGAAAKESFVPFAMVLMATWLWVDAATRTKRHLVSVVVSVAAAFGALAIVQVAVAGYVSSPLAFAATLRGPAPLASSGFLPWRDRTLGYVLIWLLPLAIPRLRRLPRHWLWAAATMSVTALLLSAYHEAAPGTLARAWFTTAGAPLSLAASIWLLESHPLKSQV